MSVFPILLAVIQQYSLSIVLCFSGGGRHFTNTIRIQYSSFNKQTNRYINKVMKTISRMVIFILFFCASFVGFLNVIKYSWKMIDLFSLGFRQTKNEKKNDSSHFPRIKNKQKLMIGDFYFHPQESATDTLSKIYNLNGSLL